MENTIFEKTSYLSFKLANEIFAVSVHKVLEVLEIQNITEVPKTPEYIKGVINFRGDILPVIDTRQKFNMPSKENDEKTVIIVFDLEIDDRKIQLGAIADGVSDVFELEEKDIKSVPEMGSNYNTEFIKGMIKIEDAFIMILNVEKVFSTEEVELYTEIKNEEQTENEEE